MLLRQIGLHTVIDRIAKPDNVHFYHSNYPRRLVTHECYKVKIKVSDRMNLPEGYHSITPYFTVADADRLIEFLVVAFGASIIKEDRNDQKRIQHARLRVGNSIIMLNEATETYSPNQSQMHLYVDDTDAAYEMALQSGAISIMAPNNRPHGDRMAGIKDPTGNIWWIATHSQ